MTSKLNTLAYSSIGLSLLLTIWFLLSGRFFEGEIDSPDFEKIKNIQPFISGISIPLITFGTTLLIISTFRNTNLQNISNNFFKLIDQNRKILDGVNIDVTHLPESYIKSNGKDFFDDLCGRIADDYSALCSGDDDYLSSMDESLKLNARGETGKELLIKIYDHYFHVHQSDLGHYFRNLYYIVRYIEKSRIRKDEKIEFIKILRSQLSNYELLLLSYNCIHPYGHEFFKYVESYELLKSLNNELKVPKTYSKRIIDIEVIKSSYPHIKLHWTSEQ